jgi:hypothetical protein
MVVHTVSYFIVGGLAYNLADYPGLFNEPSMREYMRPIDHPLVVSGVLFQPLRGVLFGLVFYALRDALFSRNNGWLVVWLALLVFGIFSTFGPTPGSIEGIIYTQVPLWIQLKGLPEILIQSLLLAYVSHYWVCHPDKKWLGRVLVGLFILVLLMGAVAPFANQLASSAA